MITAISLIYVYFTFKIGDSLAFFMTLMVLDRCMKAQVLLKVMQEPCLNLLHSCVFTHVAFL